MRADACQAMLSAGATIRSMRKPTEHAQQARGARRAPGQHARARVLRLRMRTLLALGVLAVTTGALGRAFGLHSGWFIASELALLATMFLVSRFVLPLVDRHDRGARGEESVGRLLDACSTDGWCIVHDARLEHGNIDHIVLGPGGVFTVETKSHPGPVRVQQIHGSTLRQAQDHARLLEAVVGERVEALLVYSRAWVDKPLGRRRGVRVLPARMLTGYVQRRRPVLDAQRIERARLRIEQAVGGAPSPRSARLRSPWPAQSHRRR